MNFSKTEHVLLDELTPGCPRHVNILHQFQHVRLLNLRGATEPFGDALGGLQCLQPVCGPRACSKFFIPFFCIAKSRRHWMFFARPEQLARPS